MAIFKPPDARHGNPAPRAEHPGGHRPWTYARGRLQPERRGSTARASTVLRETARPEVASSTDDARDALRPRTRECPHRTLPRVIKTDGCPRGGLERSLELWFGPLEVWTNGSIREGKVHPASMNRTVRFHARFSADGEVLEVKSISVPPLPDAVENWIPILKNFSPGPLGTPCDATIEWHAICLKLPYVCTKKQSAIVDHVPMAFACSLNSGNID